MKPVMRPEHVWVCMEEDEWWSESLASWRLSTPILCGIMDLDYYFVCPSDMGYLLVRVAYPTRELSVRVVSSKVVQHALRYNKVDLIEGTPVPELRLV